MQKDMATCSPFLCSEATIQPTPVMHAAMDSAKDIAQLTASSSIHLSRISFCSAERLSRPDP